MAKQISPTVSLFFSISYIREFDYEDVNLLKTKCSWSPFFDQALQNKDKHGFIVLHKIQFLIQECFIRLFGRFSQLGLPTFVTVACVQAFDHCCQLRHAILHITE